MGEKHFRGLGGIRRAFATPSALTMLFLGFGSGLPFLLVGGTLSTWLRDTGVGLTAIGLISYASFFYALKFFWAPLVDRWAVPLFRKLGRRRSWLLTSQLLLLVALAAMGVSDPAVSITAFVALAAVASFAGATQDIVVDAYRIEIAPAEAQAALAATYTLGYRVALILSGAGVLYLAELSSWRLAYLAMAGLFLLPIGATLLAREPERVADVGRAPTLVGSFLQPFLEFFSRNGLVLGLALLAFVGLFKFPDQIIGVLSGPFYLDCGYSKAEIATVSKLYGVWVGVAGAFLGGAGVAMFRMRPVLVLAAIAVAVSNLAFLLMAQFPAQLWAFVVAISADNLSQGLAGTVLVAFMSSLTHRHFTATQYALLVSLANLPGKLAAGVSGMIVEASSYGAFFLLSALSVVPALLLLTWLGQRLDAQPVVLVADGVT
ncbi:MAG: AmpG family muropeptide MFS transporter [Myxococcota bacterium]